MDNLSKILLPNNFVDHRINKKDELKCKIQHVGEQILYFNKTELAKQFLSQNNTLPHGEYGKVKKQTIFSNSRHQKYTARQKILHLNRSSPGKHRWPLCPFYIHKARGECQEQTLFISLLMFNLFM